MCGGNGRQWETIGSIGDNGRQDFGKANTPSKTCRHICGETTKTRVDKGRRVGRQDLGKADTPSNTGTMGDKGRQDLGKADTPSNTGRQDKTPSNTGTHAAARQWETKSKDKTSKRRTHHPTQAQVWGDNRRQWETIGLMGDKGRQDLGKADKGRQDLGKANTPSNTCRHTCGETMGDKGRRVDKTSGRPTHHPTQAHMWGRQWA